MTETDQQTLEELERRLKTLLPETYQDRYDKVQPVSMGSAGLKYGLDGKVAWNDQTLDRVDTEIRMPDKTTVDSYGATVRGASDAAKHGVAVRVDTNAGPLVAEEHDRSLVREADKPRKEAARIDPIDD